MTGPQRVPGTSAAEHLPPAFPERAAWGTAGKLRAWQAEALDQAPVVEDDRFVVPQILGEGE